jgi:hypothetical protein
MSKTNDGPTSIYYVGQLVTGRPRPEGLDKLDRIRDASIGWTKGGRLKITKKVAEPPLPNQKK